MKMMCLDLLSQDGICEKVWARKLSYNTAEIENLPVISLDYKYKDVIEFDPQTLNVTRIIRDGGYSSTEFIEYKGEFPKAKREWKAKGYQVEGLVPGILAVSRKHYETDISCPSK
jgi:hypothetical protein